MPRHRPAGAIALTSTATTRSLAARVTTQSWAAAAMTYYCRRRRGLAFSAEPASIPSFSGTSLATLDTGVGANRDVMQDFSADTIRLTEIDANLNIAGDQPFSFIGTNAFTAASQVRFVLDGSGNSGQKRPFSQSPSLRTSKLELQFARLNCKRRSCSCFASSRVLVSIQSIAATYLYVTGRSGRAPSARGAREKQPRLESLDKKSAAST